ncbi:putative rNA-directed DNA polymerase [Rickettsia hoogstraalii str. RCCE3]|nr:putative rNA-directed DNA polymerase [Rickettsia hoogstraalii str. RCCE3]
MHKLIDNNLLSVKPIKRVYIPKRKGKLRPLGLPTILDRCRQAVVKSALEPYWKLSLRVVVTALDLDVAPTMQYREFLLLFAWYN